MSSEEITKLIQAIQQLTKVINCQDNITIQGNLLINVDSQCHKIVVHEKVKITDGDRWSNSKSIRVPLTFQNWVAKVAVATEGL